jgi:hypothetical protein
MMDLVHWVLQLTELRAASNLRLRDSATDDDYPEKILRNELIRKGDATVLAKELETWASAIT